MRRARELCDSTREDAFSASRESESNPIEVREEQKTVTLGAQRGVEIERVEMLARALERRVEDSLGRLRGRRNKAPDGGARA